MIERPLSEIAAAVRGTLRGPDAVVSAVGMDSRAVGPGSLFVAISGERVDGHDFVATRSNAARSPPSCIGPRSPDP